MDFFTTMLVMGGSQLLGGLLQADAAEEAAGIQAGASQAGIAEQRRQFDMMQGNLQPFMGAGTNSLANLQQANGGDYSAFENSPGYQYARQ